MFKRRLRVLVLALILIIAGLPCEGGTVRAAGETIDVSAMPQLIDELRSGNNVRLIQDITVSAGQFDGYVELLSGTELTIDLNGHEIDLNGATGFFAIKNGTGIVVDDTSTGSGNTYNYQIYKVNAQYESYSSNESYTGGAIINGAYPIFSLESASAESLTINRGYIGGFNSAQEGAVISARGANKTVTLGSGAVIDNNTTSAGHGGAICIMGEDSGHSTLIINGAVISNNTSQQMGGGIYCDRCDIEINSGYITNNRTISHEWGCNGGGLYADGGVTVTMNDGYFTNNNAGAGGGGFQLGSYYPSYASNKFVMNGGYFVGNTANRSEGGGITIGHQANAVINAGVFTYNKTLNVQDWGGGGIFIQSTGYCQMPEAYIADNSADGFGGGLAGCSTGRVFTYDNGAAIFDNTADGTHLSGSESSKNRDHLASQDEVFMNNGYDDYFCCLNTSMSNVMLGGGYEVWSGSSDGHAFGPVTDDSRVTATYLCGANNNADAAAKAAATAAIGPNTVIIMHNSSTTHGGGVLCNGYLVIGTPQPAATALNSVYDRMEVLIDKRVKDEADNNVAHVNGEFTFAISTDYQGTDILSYITSHTRAEAGYEYLGTADLLIPVDYVGTRDFYLFEKSVNSADSYIKDNTIYKIAVTAEKTTNPVYTAPIFDSTMNNVETVDRYAIATVQVWKGVYNGVDEPVWTLLTNGTEYTYTHVTAEEHEDLLTLMSGGGAYGFENVVITPTPTPTVGITPTPTVGITPTPTVGITPTPTVGITPTPTVGITPTPTVGITPTPTAGITPTPTAGITPTPTVGITPSPTVEVTPTPTAKVVNPTMGATDTPINTTPTPTPTPTANPTATPSPKVPGTGTTPGAQPQADPGDKTGVQTLTTGNTAQYTATNMRIVRYAAPATEDTNNLEGWIMLLLASMVVFIGAAIYYLREVRNRRRM
ncbi:MAG: hypothetical protein K5662_02175 [Lachnospiraceae bacterium]|nr:hypothetical protein [Lachnospiraceae bacterium]